MLGDAVDRSGLHVGARTQLQRNPLVPQDRCQSTEAHRAVLGDVDVVDDTHSVAQPIGTAERDRLLNRRQAERLTRMNREAALLFRMYSKASR